MSRLLMVSGDSAAARGEHGPFYNTLSELAKYWERIDVLTPPTPGPARVDLFNNVSLYPSPRSRLAQPWFILDQGRALARPDLIVSHDYGLFLNGLGAAWLSRTIGVPYVSELHHVEGYPRAASPRERIQPALTRAYVAWARPRARVFRIVNAGELKPLLRAWGVPEAQILLLYSLYLDLNIFRPAPAELAYDALFCGRLQANKAPLLFLESLALARPQLGHLRALMIGRGPQRPALEARARQLGLEVEFVDWVAAPADLAAIYRRSRALVCTSFSEGGPRVVAEALACGTPVVTTRVGLARELVLDGVNGFQADWSAADLAARLAQVAGDAGLRARLSAEAPAAVQPFEKTRVIRDYALGYQRLIA